MIVALVYLWGRRSSSTGAGQVEPARLPPELGDVDDSMGLKPRPAPSTVSAEPSVEPSVAAAPAAEEPVKPDPAEPPPVPDKVVILHLVAGEDRQFDATELVAALRAEGLRFGHFDIFHRFTGEGNPGPASQPLFSVANMVKPGTFELDKLRDTTMTGVSLFLQIPGPPDPLAAFADMLATGRRLAATLEGRLVDAQGCAVTRQSASHMREDVINHLHSAKIASEQEARSEV